MNPGMDYNPMDESKLMERSSKGAFTRFKEPGELTQQEAMTIFVLEEELAKHKKENHLTPFQKGKLEEELLKLREKERFKENKEAAQIYKTGDGWNKISSNNRRIQELEKDMQSSGRLDPDKKQELQKLRNQEVPIDNEQFKVLLKDIIEQIHSPELKKFVSESCIFDLDTTAESELTIDPLVVTDKVVLTFNPKTFYDISQTKVIDKFGVERHLKLFNPAKAAFLIGQGLGHIFNQPEDWKDIAPKIQIVVGSEVGSWADYVGLCMSSPDKAERLSPETYKYFRKILSGLKDKKINFKKEKKSFKSPIFAQGEGDQNQKQDSFKKGFVGRFVERLGFGSIDSAEEMAIFASRFKKALWKKTDWYQRAVSENEAKEVSRIVARQEGIIDRDKSLRQLLNDGKFDIDWSDRYMLRTILLADMQFEDFSNERIHIYLQACDYKYRESNGEVINEESYNFIVRLHRNSNAKGRRGTKPCEYRKVEIGEVYSMYNPATGTYLNKVATSEVYVRKARHKLMEDVLEEIDTFSGREISNVSKEFLEYLKIDNKLIDIDETWGKEQGKRDPDNKYKCVSGNWKNIVGDEFADKMMGNYNNRGDIPKLNPDQIAIIARVIAEELKAGSKDKFFPKEIQSIIYREHAKGALVEAYNYYKPIFLENDTYRGYINFFLHNSGIETDSLGTLSRIATKGDTDQSKLNNFIDAEKNSKKKDYDYDDAHKILEEYNGLEQEEKPAWEKDAEGNVKDASANKLKREFIEKRSERQAAEDIDKLEKAMDKYINKVMEIVAKANLPLALREVIRDVALASNDVFILNDVKAIISQFDAGRLSSDEVYDTNQTIQEVVLGLRPYRRELIKIKGLLGALGIEYLGSAETQKISGYSKSYGVQIEQGRNFQKDAKGEDRAIIAINNKKKLMQDDKYENLAEDEKIKYDELREKLKLIGHKISQLKKDKTKKDELEEAQKDLTTINEEIKTYEDKMGTISDKGVMVELQEDIVKAINDIDLIIKDIDKYTAAIDKEIDDKVTKKYKNLFNLIPIKIIDEAKNPEGEYDKERIIMALKYVSLFIERIAQKNDAKSMQEKKGNEGGGKDKGKEKESKSEPVQPDDDSD